MFVYVYSAHKEARENTLLLSPLKKYLQQLSEATQEQYPLRTNIFVQMFHYLSLLWKNSRYFSTPSHLVIVLTEICNAFITRTTRFVNSRHLFQMELVDALERVEAALVICEEFQRSYEVIEYYYTIFLTC